MHGCLGKHSLQEGRRPIMVGGVRLGCVVQDQVGFGCGPFIPKAFTGCWLTAAPMPARYFQARPQRQRSFAGVAGPPLFRHMPHRHQALDDSSIRLRRMTIAGHWIRRSGWRLAADGGGGQLVSADVTVLAAPPLPLPYHHRTTLQAGIQGRRWASLNLRTLT